MTTPNVPSFVTSVATVARFSLLRLLRGKKLRLAAGATFFVVIAAIVARYAREDATAETAYRDALGYGFFRFLVYL
ncbi:hypothetical protein, partial [Salmonella sp. SAL4458]|uniref:hypothetical protein n=1 Tax=Salmonella sp. SAL4458 TaxID=3159913 RepID=UPI00397A432B